jgi:hypothetical protein
MQHTTAVPAPAAHDVPAAVLDVERLEVFGHAVLRDQLGRASLSVVLNISEGAVR